MSQLGPYIYYAVIGSVLGLAFHAGNSLFDQMYEITPLDLNTEALTGNHAIHDIVMRMNTYRDTNEELFKQMVASIDRYLYFCNATSTLANHSPVTERNRGIVFLMNAKKHVQVFYDSSKEGVPRIQVHLHSLYKEMLSAIDAHWEGFLSSTLRP